MNREFPTREASTKNSPFPPLKRGGWATFSYGRSASPWRIRFEAPLDMSGITIRCAVGQLYGQGNQMRCYSLGTHG